VMRCRWDDRVADRCRRARACVAGAGWRDSFESGTCTRSGRLPRRRRRRRGSWRHRCRRRDAARWRCPATLSLRAFVPGHLRGEELELELELVSSGGCAGTATWGDRSA
jgi:hypothetical protein